MAARVLTEEDLEPLLERLARLEQELAGRPAAAGDLDTAAAATRAKVSRDTILNWIATKGLPAHRAPGTRSHLIRPADLEAFLASPSARRPPPKGGPIDLVAEARRIVRRRGG